jgi:hypothetical protein
MDALDGLREGRDRADLVLAGAEPRAAYGKLIRNLDALRSDVRQMESGETRADLPGAIGRAAELLSEHDGPRRLFILSDMQRTNWRGVSPAGALPEDPEHPIRVTMLPIPGGAGNTALSRPRLQTERPLAGRPVRASVAVTRHGPTDPDRNAIEVRAAINDEIVERREVDLAGAPQRRVDFSLRFEEPGEHRAMFSIASGDALAVDDRAHLVADVAERSEVLVVGDDDPQQPTGSSYFLLRALAPGEEGEGGLSPRHVAGNEWSGAGLGDADTVLIGDVDRLPDEALAALRRYLRQGGGVLMFCGPGPVAANAEALEEQATEEAGDEQHLLPWRPIGPRRGTRRIADGMFDSDTLRPFDARAPRALRRIAFRRTYDPGEPRPDSRTLLEYDDGSPALSVQPVGRGQLMLANFSPSPEAGDLAKHGAFVALIHTLVDALRSGSDQPGPARVGRAVVRSVGTESLGNPDDAERIELAVSAPGDASARAAAQRSGEGGWSLEIQGVDRAGFYEVQRDGRPVATIGANIDPRESDLRPIEAQDTSEEAQDRAATVRASQQNGGASDGLGGVPLWPWLLLGAALAFAAELTIVSVWSR